MNSEYLLPGEKGCADDRLQPALTHHPEFLSPVFAFTLPLACGCGVDIRGNVTTIGSDTRALVSVDRRRTTLIFLGQSRFAEPPRR